MTPRPSCEDSDATIGLTRLADRPDARVRLYCVPPSGAGPEFFLPWAPILPATIDPVAAEFPGRGTRTGEPSVTDVRRAAAGLAAVIAADLRRHRAPDGFYALFGHSFGSLLAFEAAHRLRRAHGTEPGLLAVSANPAPHRNGLRDYIARHLGDGVASLNSVMGWAEPVDGGTDPALARIVYTPFLADAVALLQHTHHDRPPLTVPISVFGGDDDPIVAPGLLDEWAAYTTAGTHVHLHPGGHHYLRSAFPGVISELTRDMLEAYRDVDPCS